jgi:hypothetical protein
MEDQQGTSMVITDGQPEDRPNTSESIDKAVTARAEMLAAALRDIEAFDFARSAATKVEEVSSSGATLETATAAVASPASSAVESAPAAPAQAIAGGPAPMASKPPEKSTDPFRSAWKQLAKAAPPSTSSSILGEAPPTGAPVTYWAQPVDDAATSIHDAGDAAAGNREVTPAPFQETAPLAPAPITWSTPVGMEPQPTQPAQQPYAMPAVIEPVATGPWVPPSSFDGPSLAQPGYQQFAPQQYPPAMLAPGQLPPGMYPPVPKKRAIWPWILGAVFAVIVIGSLAVISAVSVLGSKVKTTFNNISNTLPLNPPSAAFDANGYLTGASVPDAGTCGTNNEGSGTFQYADCSAVHNAKILRAQTFAALADPAATETEQAAFLDACKSDLTSWSAPEQGDSLVWRITFDQADGSKMQVCFVRYPS